MVPKIQYYLKRAFYNPKEQKKVSMGLAHRDKSRQIKFLT